MWIFAEPGADFEAEDAQQRLGEDASGHFACAQDPVYEDNRHFDDFEAALVGSELHLNLEGIAFEAYLVQFDGLEDLAPVTLETGGGVADINAQDGAHVLAGEIRHEHPAHRPVDHVHAVDITAADSHVRPSVGACVIEFEQVLRVVAEVGIHLEDVVVLVLYSPLEAAYISRAQPLFALPLDDEKAPFVPALHQALDNGGRAVGRAVVNNKHMEIKRKRTHSVDDGFYVLLFVVSRNYNKAFHRHSVFGYYVVVQRIDRTRREPVERAHKIVLAEDVALSAESITDSPEGQLGVVVLLREVAEEDVAQPVVEVLGKHASASDVALVAARREDSLLEVGGVRAVKEHLLVVVGLDDDVVGGPYGLRHHGVRLAAVGGNHELLAESADDVAEAVGGVVADAESIELHSRILEGDTFLEEASGRAQFFPHAVVAVNPLMDGGSSVDRQVHALAEGANSAYVVGMVVRDEHTADIAEVHAHLAQVLLYSARGDTRVNEYSLFARTKIIAIAATSARETTKHQSVLRHIFVSTRKDSLFL